MKDVAILGLGAMGLRMARSLLKAGRRVVVWNRNAERALAAAREGATRVDSPREAAARAAIVISMVTDDAASRAVWLDEQAGAIHGLRRGSIAIESSTLTPAWAAQLAEAVAGRGAGYLDAPVVGSRPQAEAGQLTYLVGGEAAIVDEAREALSAMGSAIHHVGPVGAGMAMKLAVNALFGVQVAALGEILGMLARSGVDEGTSVTLLSSLPIASPALERIASLVASRSFAPNFPISLVEKDLRYVVDTAARVRASVPIAAAVRDVYARAGREGHGEQDISGVARLYL